MKTTHEIKRFLKEKFGVTTRGQTNSGKGQWQGFYIPSDRSPENLHKLVYTQPPFPEDFRKFCIKVVYPNSLTLQAQSSAGNISAYSISMQAPEWEPVINTYVKPEA